MAKVKRVGVSTDARVRARAAGPSRGTAGTAPRRLRQRGQVRRYGVREVVSVGRIPVDGPGHDAADTRIGAGRDEAAAVGARSQAVERVVHHGGGTVPAAR